MLFPTLNFGLFFFAVFLVSWRLADTQRAQKLFLIAASYFFYGYWDWRFVSLLVASSLINYIAGSLLRGGSPSYRRAVVVAAVTLNLAILATFKYFGFFIESLSALLYMLGVGRDLMLFEIILPIGISFFTFQGISYVVDVYRRDLRPVDDPIDLFLFISFFPQLVAGPIVRASDFLPQLSKQRTLDSETVMFGFVLIVVGLFKKMIVASYLATEVVDNVFSYPSGHSSADLLLACYAFVVQIYCDFSGYSDMAIGLAALLGFHFKRNFDRPLAATTLQELWQRWHISLTSWLRDYLYRPLRGRKRGQWHMYRNLFLTMLIAGLWHGAAWTFVIWGGLQGAMLVVERIIRGAIKKRASVMPLLGRLPFGAASFFGWFVTFNAFALSAVFFRANDMRVVEDFYTGLAAFKSGAALWSPFVILLITGSVAAQFMPGDLPERVAHRSRKLGPLAAGAALGCGLLVIEMLGPTGVAPFIYFQF
jgi:alginate O-acetyltransferase complex protein AlgI